MSTYSYIDRDISWLSFNGRVLEEAASPSLPLMERIRFLSIYSSNLDEFYRVRIPSLMALEKIKKEKAKKRAADTLEKATEIIAEQLQRFGQLAQKEIIPALAKEDIHFVYNKPLPANLLPQLEHIFYHELLGAVHYVQLKGKSDFFPRSNVIYLLFEYKDAKEGLLIATIPEDRPSRFITIHSEDGRYIVFVDDIIRHFLPLYWKEHLNPSAFSFKITRDADLDLQDEFEGDLAEKIEKQIVSRDMGFATRLLYAPGMPEKWLETLIRSFGLEKASIVKGGAYHNLKDLAQIPLGDAALNYPPWPSRKKLLPLATTLLDHIAKKDLLLHPPYDDYSSVLRFFNEAATHPQVKEIWITLYRIAGDSKIASSLITAAQNGKMVTVFMELKARFDEANNISWAKRMKAAGIRIVYSIPGLKVHAKVALVRFRGKGQDRYTGILATGNFNERTARFYTDHVLMTGRKPILKELEKLFLFLVKRRKPNRTDEIKFRELLVAQFNLPDRFRELVAQETFNAKAGLPSGIRIKMNNLEDRDMIDLLYNASNAGVPVQLIVRGICCLEAGIKGQSENIEVKRIVDRYLEHGRIFYFHNNGKQVVLAGSSDWMERNIHRRIEVCFPVVEPSHQQKLIEILDLQWADNTQSTYWGKRKTDPAAKNPTKTRSQEAIRTKIFQDA